MPTWFWLNVPLMALFFLAMTGGPAWLVLNWPDQHRTTDRRPSVAERVPVDLLI